MTRRPPTPVVPGVTDARETLRSLLRAADDPPFSVLISRVSRVALTFSGLLKYHGRPRAIPGAFKYLKVKGLSPKRRDGRVVEGAPLLRV